LFSCHIQFGIYKQCLCRILWVNIGCKRRFSHWWVMLVLISNNWPCNTTFRLGKVVRWVRTLNVGTWRHYVLTCILWLTTLSLFILLKTFIRSLFIWKVLRSLVWLFHFHFPHVSLRQKCIDLKLCCLHHNLDCVKALIYHFKVLIDHLPLHIYHHPHNHLNFKFTLQYQDSTVLSHSTSYLSTTPQTLSRPRHLQKFKNSPHLYYFPKIRHFYNKIHPNCHSETIMQQPTLNSYYSKHFY
jgi:hypothetical protein